jgi:transposase
MRTDIIKHIERIMLMDIKINYSSLAKQYNCDPRTVKNYVTGKTQLKRKKVVKKSKLEDFKSIIADKVDNYNTTALSVFQFIQKKGYTGKYGLVKNYVKSHKKDQMNKATIRFETMPGCQAQVDFKEKKKMINKHGQVFEIYIFLFVLGYSRVKYFEITENKNQKTVLNSLMNAFLTISGVPKEILFDNMATVVDRHNTVIGQVQYNKKFMQFAKDFNFTPIACKPYRAQTKGKVESLAKLTNRLDVYNGEFETIDDLKKIAVEVNEELNNEISQAINKSPNSRLEEEKKHLLKLPNETIIKSYQDLTKELKVSKDSMIKYLGNRYSVPVAFVDKSIDLEIDHKNNNLKIYSNGHLIAEHGISDRLLNYKKADAIEILKSDAFKNSSIEDIELIIASNMNNMDTLLS